MNISYKRPFNGNTLKSIRKQRKLTQTELAKKLNLSPGLISLYETHKRNPSLKSLVRISCFFNRSTDYFLEP